MNEPPLPLRSLYTRSEIWQRTAREIGGIYIAGDFWQSEQIRVKISPWTITLQIENDREQMPVTRLTTRYLSEDGFTFAIFREWTFRDEGHLNQAPEVPIGIQRFDELFRVAGEPPEQVRRLLTNEAILGYLLADPQIGLYAEPVPGSRRRIDLTCTVAGVPMEERRLVALFELVGETLQHLCTIGSAMEQAPPEQTQAI